MYPAPQPRRGPPRSNVHASATPANTAGAAAELAPREAETPESVGEPLLPLPEPAGSNPAVTPGSNPLPNLDTPNTPVGAPGPSASVAPAQAPQRREPPCGQLTGFLRA